MLTLQDQTGWKERSLNRDETKFLSDGVPVTWIGHGMSLAVCSLASELCRLSGIRSSFTTPERAGRIKPHKLIEVSSSGRQLSRHAIMHVTSSINFPSERSPACEVVIVDAKITWTGIDFALACARWLCEAFGVAFSEKAHTPQLVSMETHGQTLVLVDEFSPVFQQLVLAMDGKVPFLNFRIAGVEDFGHGLHHLVWREPQTFKVLFLSGQVQNDAQRKKTQRWLTEQGVAYLEVPSKHDAGSMVYLLQAFEILLGMIGERAGKLGFETENAPMPREVDTLR